MCSYPSRLKRLNGNLSSGHLVSCRQSTSGRSALRNFATRLMRSRTELMFQVVTVSCMRPKCHCERSEALPAACDCGWRLLRLTQVGLARLAHHKMPISGKPEIGASLAMTARLRVSADRAVPES